MYPSCLSSLQYCLDSYSSVSPDAWLHTWLSKQASAGGRTASWLAGASSSSPSSPFSTSNPAPTPLLLPSYPKRRTNTFDSFSHHPSRNGSVLPQPTTATGLRTPSQRPESPVLPLFLFLSIRPHNPVTSLLQCWLWWRTKSLRASLSCRRGLWRLRVSRGGREWEDGGTGWSTDGLAGCLWDGGL